MNHLPDHTIEIQHTVDFFADNNIIADVCRLDLIHPVISGNKWFKLKFYLQEAIALRKTTIVTFGGAFSNHIVATAAACSLQGIKSVGIIRGERPAILSPTLLQALEEGMELIFSSREDYKSKLIPSSLLQDENIYIIPEGGYGINGAKGFASAMQSIDTKPYTHIIAAMGTGTMLAGIVMAASSTQKIIGIPVLKNFTGAKEAVFHLLNENEQHRQVQLIHDYHFGGYAKHSPSLFQFMNDFYSRNAIPSDFVYTGKLFYGVADMLKNKFFSAGSRLLIIHSGGLQGNRSLPEGTLIF